MQQSHGLLAIAKLLVKSGTTCMAHICRPGMEIGNVLHLAALELLTFLYTLQYRLRHGIVCTFFVHKLLFF